MSSSSLRPPRRKCTVTALGVASRHRSPALEPAVPEAFRGKPNAGGEDRADPKSQASHRRDRLADDRDCAPRRLPEPTTLQCRVRRNLQAPAKRDPADAMNMILCGDCTLPSPEGRADSREARAGWGPAAKRLPAPACDEAPTLSAPDPTRLDLRSSPPSPEGREAGRVTVRLAP